MPHTPRPACFSVPACLYFCSAVSPDACCCRRPTPPSQPLLPPSPDPRSGLSTTPMDQLLLRLKFISLFQPRPLFQWERTKNGDFTFWRFYVLGIGALGEGGFCRSSSPRPMQVARKGKSRKYTGRKGGGLRVTSTRTQHSTAHTPRNPNPDHRDRYLSDGGLDTMMKGRIDHPLA